MSLWDSGAYRFGACTCRLRKDLPNNLDLYVVNCVADNVLVCIRLLKILEYRVLLGSRVWLGSKQCTRFENYCFLDSVASSL